MKKQRAKPHPRRRVHPDLEALAVDYPKLCRDATACAGRGGNVSEPFPAAEKVEGRPPVTHWGVIDNDGNRACWWCLCTVHPSVAELHDRWHYRVWKADQ